MISHGPARHLLQATRAVHSHSGALEHVLFEVLKLASICHQVCFDLSSRLLRFILKFASICPQVCFDSSAQGSVSLRLDQLTGRLQARDLSQTFPNCGRQILQACGLSQKGRKWLVPRTWVYEGDDAFFHMVPHIHCNGSVVCRAFGSHDAATKLAFALARHHGCPCTPCFETQHYDA